MVRQLLALILVLFLGYGLIEAFPLLAGPSLRIDSPRTFAEFETGVVLVEGQAKRVSSLTLNGSPLLRDKEGLFSSTLTYSRGGSILTFVAADRFGRTEVETRTIFVP